MDWMAAEPGETKQMKLEGWGKPGGELAGWVALMEQLSQASLLTQTHLKNMTF